MLCLLPKLAPADNIDAYLYKFEETAIREGWLEEKWAQSMAPLLTGEAQLAYYALPPASQMITHSWKSQEFQPRDHVLLLLQQRIASSWHAGKVPSRCLNESACQLPPVKTQ